MADADAQKRSFEESFPDQLTKITMVGVPDGSLEVDGKKHEIKNLFFSETEIPWEVFEIWALRTDLTADQNAQGVDAQSRPSKPYAVIFSGFGHHGHPAICMSQFAAEEFCKWLSKRTGRKYRLPTVAEWRYAALAGSKEGPADLDPVAWYWENADDTTHPVGSKPANAWGLKGMFGNAAEWAIDANGKGVVCGGSWKDKAPQVGPFAVKPYDPKWNEADPQNPKSRWWLANGQFIGLRLVCEGE